MAAIPCSFDLIASTLQTFGLIWINVQIFQMLRGPCVIFSAIFSMIRLDRRISATEWVRIMLVVIALVIIGLASTQIPSGDDDDESESARAGQRLLGVLLVTASEFVQAGQAVTEQFVLPDLNLPALEVVGLEGILRCILTVIIGFLFALIVSGRDPSPLGSSLENSMNSFLQLGHGKTAGISDVFVIAVLGLNMFSMLVTSQRGAINGTVIGSARTILV
jgi:drug/metabolite transporter (DMT)-like permease